MSRSNGSDEPSSHSDRLGASQMATPPQGANLVQKHLRILRIGKSTYGYTEFQSLGAPDTEYGAVGDTYLDLTPGALSLYGRYPNDWKRWPGPQLGDLLIHPEHPSRCLWCNESIGWFAPGRLKFHSGQTQSSVLSYAYNNSTSSKRKRKRTTATSQDGITSQPYSNMSASYSLPLSVAVAPVQQEELIFSDVNSSAPPIPNGHPQMSERPPFSGCTSGPEAQDSRTSEPLITGRDSQKQQPFTSGVALTGGISTIPGIRGITAHAALSTTHNAERHLTDITSKAPSTLTAGFMELLGNMKAFKAQVLKERPSLRPVEVSVPGLQKSTNLVKQREFPGGVRETVAQRGPSPLANVPQVIGAEVILGRDQSAESLLQEVQTLRAASSANSKKLAEVLEEIAELKKENVSLKNQLLRNSGVMGTGYNLSSHNESAFLEPLPIEEAYNSTDPDVIHDPDDYLLAESITCSSMAPIPDSPRLQGLLKMTTDSVTLPAEFGKIDTASEAKNDVHQEISPACMSAVSKRCSPEGDRPTSTKELSYPPLPKDVHAIQDGPPNHYIGAHPETGPHHSEDPSTLEKDLLSNDSHKLNLDGEAKKNHISAYLETSGSESADLENKGENNEYMELDDTSVISTASPSEDSLWLKQIHRSILFATSGDIIVCRICLARGFRGFQIKLPVDEFHAAMTMQEHCEKEHPKESEVMKNLAEVALQELYGTIID
ncbi:hypothetical protein GALMADRAFT_250073 [Galerina marginata CBS 339.88]|uniref:Uncharacterized protein n=1 Tax=Galerina marginata (strain CBS 339.88) TaxID=685588 RepID=A0A067T5J2_GALM3|nr:hypothetical protein GALMADRAFT_250073 [Galerina marginata CBS 339.88]